jgi:hypothetical protein
MASGSRAVYIGLGVPSVTTTSGLVLYESGQAGVQGAKRTLTHPDGDNFAPITYYKNPTRVFNLDNEVLPAPISSSILTLGSRQTIRHETAVDDVLIREVWEGTEGRTASMPTYFWRLLYEYLRNPPPFSPTAQTFIEWAPRDRSAKVYNVELYQLRVGGGGGADFVFDVDDFRQAVGPEIRGPLESFDVSPTGLITRTVEMRLRVVSEV